MLLNLNHCLYELVEALEVLEPKITPPLWESDCPESKFAQMVILLRTNYYNYYPVKHRNLSHYFCEMADRLGELFYCDTSDPESLVFQTYKELRRTAIRGTERLGEKRS